MTKLKKKIKVINSLPSEQKEKKSIISILIVLIITLTIITCAYLVYTELIPYIYATDIEKIIGKKTNITDCNTKDYLIINDDKTYTLSLTNENCEQELYKGNIKIKNNNIIFNKNLIGIIDNKYNIIINDNLFESDKNE